MPPAKKDHPAALDPGLEAALLKTMVESVPVIMYVDEALTLEGGEDDLPVFVSPQIRTLLGYSAEEWLDDPALWRASLHPEDRERVGEFADAATEEFSVEYRMVHRDGHTIWVREIATVVRNEAGKAYWNGVIFDITEQKRAEERFRDSEEQYRSLVDNIPAIVYLDPVDENEQSIYVSPKIEEVLGVTPNEWLTNPTTWRELLHPDDVDKAWDTYAEYRASGKQLHSQYRMVRRDGRIVWIDEEAEILKDAQGNPYLIQGLMHDITEAKAAEEARDFQAQLLQSISDAVIAYDTEMVITSWNRAAQVLYGWAAEEVLGQPMPEGLRYEPEELDRGSFWDPFIEDMSGWIGRIVQRDRDGYEIQIETKGMPLRAADGTIRGYVMVNREIAEL